MSDDLLLTRESLRRYLYAQAKQCRTVTGAAVLLCVKNYMMENYPADQPPVEGCPELWQAVDALTESTQPAAAAAAS